MAVNHLEDFPITNHITEIENTINALEPDTLFVPFPDQNEDHRRVFEAAITASRPHDKNFYIKNVLAYEQPCTLQTNRLGLSFVPQYFVPIDIEKKLELYQLYASQVKPYRSLDHVRALATIRGMQCNAPFAEAFSVVRLT